MKLNASKFVASSIAAATLACGLVVASSLSASASSINIGSQVCGFGGPAAASTAYVNGTSVHYHQANGVSWASQTFGSGFHRFSYGNGVVTMQIAFPTGAETGYAFSCANGSF